MDGVLYKRNVHELHVAQNIIYEKEQPLNNRQGIICLLSSVTWLQLSSKQIKK